MEFDVESLKNADRLTTANKAFLLKVRTGVYDHYLTNDLEHRIANADALVDAMLEHLDTFFPEWRTTFQVTDTKTTRLGKNSIIQIMIYITYVSDMFFDHQGDNYEKAYEFALFTQPTWIAPAIKRNLELRRFAALAIRERLSNWDYEYTSLFSELFALVTRGTPNLSGFLFRSVMHSRDAGKGLYESMYDGVKFCHDNFGACGNGLIPEKYDVVFDGELNDLRESIEALWGQWKLLPALESDYSSKDRRLAKMLAKQVKQALGVSNYYKIE